MVRTLPFLQALTEHSLPGLERNLFFSEKWLKVIIDTYGTDIFVKYMLNDDGSVKSYIVYSVVRNFLEWKICICSYCDYCDCFVADRQDWDLFLGALREEFPGFRIAIRNLRDEAVRSCETLKVLSKEYFHQLDLRGSLDEIWREMADSFKAAVHQAERFGVTVRPCPKSELQKFYELHLKVRKNKYRIFPQPFRFFEKIWDRFISQGQGVLLGAFDPKGCFVGGNIYLICGNTLYYKFNTSAIEALGLRPNNLLFWEGVKYAKSQGLVSLDLGSSGLEQKGLVHFKNQTGAVLSEITHLGYNPPEYKFSQKRILKIFTKISTLPWMPEAVVRAGSRLIYPYLA